MTQEYRRVRRRRMSKRERTMRKIKSLVRCIVPILVVAFCVVSLVNSFKNMYTLPDNYEIERYRVESGDTLWSIGKRHTDENIDIRVWINEVEKLNGIDANIRAGQWIDIYVLTED